MSRNRCLVSMAMLNIALTVGCSRLTVEQAVVQQDHGELERALHRESPDQRFADGRAPLHIAAEMGDGEAVVILLDHEARVDAPDSQGRTALHAAANNGREDIVRTLLKRKALVDAVDAHRRTPLHVAAQRGRTAIVVLLIDSGANPNGKDDSGHTALTEAQENQHQDTVEEIRRRGGRLPE